MSLLFRLLVTTLRVLSLGRQHLILENLALRQQLNVMRRSVKRPKVQDHDSLFWLALRRVFPRWREHLLLVKPETILRWHRAGWRSYWRRKSRKRRVGRPAIGWKLARLIRRLSLENVPWGAAR